MHNLICRAMNLKIEKIAEIGKKIKRSWKYYRLLKM